MSPAPGKSRLSTAQATDDGAAMGLSQAWNDLALALVDEVHAIASANLRGIADAAKQGLESVPPESVDGEPVARGRCWSPWLVGAVIGIGVILLPRWR